MGVIYGFPFTREPLSFSDLQNLNGDIIMKTQFVRGDDTNIINGISSIFAMRQEYELSSGVVWLFILNCSQQQWINFPFYEEDQANSEDFILRKIAYLELWTWFDGPVG